MASFTVETPFVQDKAVLRSTSLIQTDRSAQITRAMLSRNTDGNYIVIAGSFVARLYDQTFRILPRVKVVDPVSTGSNLIENTVYPQTFLPGDVLTIQGAHAVFDVSGTTVGSLTYKNRVVQVTPTGAGTNGEAAVLFASLYADTFLGNTFFFVADEPNAQLYVFAKDGCSSLDVTGDGTILQGTVGGVGVAQTTVFNDTAIGTVSIVQESDGAILLTANAGIDVPAGIPIGVTVDEVYGLLCNSYALTDERPNYDVGLVTRAKVFIQALPYWDTSINLDLPEIDAAYKA